MHRCYPGVNDLDEFDCEEGDTVTLENPAYDNSFSNKGFKANLPRHHPRHPLLDLGQLASNPAFEAGALSSRHIDLTPRRPTPAPTAHPNRHTPTKIAYRPNPRTFGTDRLQRKTGDVAVPPQASRDAQRATALSPSRLPGACTASHDGVEGSQNIPGPMSTPQEGAQQRLTSSSAPAPPKHPLSQTAARQIDQHQAPMLAAAPVLLGLDPQGADSHTATLAADPSHDADGHALRQTSDMLPNSSSAGDSHANAEAADAPAVPFTAALGEQSHHEPAPPPTSRPTFALGLSPLSVKIEADPQQAVLEESQTRQSPPGTFGSSSQTGAALITPSGAASSSQASGTTSQEVKSNCKVSSTGKSKRWSALAFWKKSAGKAKQPAEAKAAAAAPADAAVSRADEELAPLRRRSSSYHSSFIALAKQGRHAKELSGGNNGLISPSSSVASWQRALPQLESESSQKFTPLPSQTAFASSQQNSSEALWSKPGAASSRASTHSPGLFPDFAPMFASTPLPGAWQQCHLPSASSSPSPTGCQEGQSAEQPLGSASEPYSEAAAQLRAAVTHAVKLLAASQAAPTDLRRDMSSAMEALRSPASLSLGSNVPILRSQEQCQLSFGGVQQPHRRDAFRRSAQSFSSQAAAVWVPQAEVQMQSCTEGENKGWVARHISADAQQQHHASNMQLENALTQYHKAMWPPDS
ncbi:hypothetical protein WJX79_002232 [Trebouxia sp. C0005]